MSDFAIQTVVEAGWSGIKNGDLLRRAEYLFEVFLTADRNLQYQQNTSKLRLGIVVLTAGSTKLDALRQHAAEIGMALATVQPGQVIQVPPAD